MKETIAIDGKNEAITINGKLLLKPKEAAEVLGLSPRTLWQLTKDRDIPCRQIGGRERRVIRYRAFELVEWMKQKNDPSLPLLGIHPA